MDYIDDILRFDEQAALRLRTLYSRFGYSQYRMSRFEEYSLYAENKDFLPSGNIITFTGAGGRLMALRPDVTLSIVKNTKDDRGLIKLYYNENVYRPDSFDFKEQMQVGLECIGDIDARLTGEVLMLARRSLEELGQRFSLDISHMGFINGLLENEDLLPEQRTSLLRCVSERNAHGLGLMCDKFGVGNKTRDAIASLAEIYGPFGEAIAKLKQIDLNQETNRALDELFEIHDELVRLDSDRDINIDFSIVNDLSYYSGVIFHGYLSGVPAKVLSGGRYDKLLRKFGKDSGAIGFAVYLDLVGQLSPTGGEKAPAEEMINIALPKGRLGEKAYAIFESSGYGCPAILDDSRRLVFESKENKVRYFWVKPSDVAIYVERGVADIGIAGKDILLEYSPDVYELLDLGIGKCRMCVAAQKGYSPLSRDLTPRVATKFPNIARGHFSKQGRQIDVIKLNGSIELAPLLGLADVIVDIVETGTTLLENDMEPVETIVDISARLISNKVSYKFKYGEISKLYGKVSAGLNKTMES